jgi:hypothetical protein
LSRALLHSVPRTSTRLELQAQQHLRVHYFQYTHARRHKWVHGLCLAWFVPGHDERHARHSSTRVGGSCRVRHGSCMVRAGSYERKCRGVRHVWRPGLACCSRWVGLPPHVSGWPGRRGGDAAGLSVGRQDAALPRLSGCCKLTAFQTPVRSDEDAARGTGVRLPLTCHECCPSVLSIHRRSLPGSPQVLDKGTYASSLLDLTLRNLTLLT